MATEVVAPTASPIFFRSLPPADCPTLPRMRSSRTPSPMAPKRDRPLPVPPKSLPELPPPKIDLSPRRTSRTLDAGPSTPRPMAAAPPPLPKRIAPTSSDDDSMARKGPFMAASSEQGRLSPPRTGNNAGMDTEGAESRSSRSSRVSGFFSRISRSPRKRDSQALPPLPPFPQEQPPHSQPQAGAETESPPERDPLPSLSPPTLSPSPKRTSRTLPLELGPSRPAAIPRPTAASRRLLGRMLKHPRVLAHLLDELPWVDFHALASTCRDFRRGWMRTPTCRDVVLGQYVPGYRYARQAGDLDQCREVKIDFHDLTLLVMSQFVPLHKYPMHALSIMSSPASSLPSSSTSVTPLDAHTTKLTALTTAHSRFVLLLQSLVHSTQPSPAHSLFSSPLEEDIDDDLEPLLSIGAGARAPALLGMRELVFPAPLSYFGAEQPQQAQTPPSRTGPRRMHSPSPSQSSAPSAFSNATPSPRALSLSPTRASGDFHALLGDRSRLYNGGKKRNRASIFGGPKVPLPPPASEPLAVKYSVANGWRRTSASRSNSGTPTPVSRPRTGTGTPPPILRMWRSESASEDDLKAPARRFTATPTSSESSLVGAPSASSRSVGMEVDGEESKSKSSSSGSASPSRRGSNLLASRSPRKRDSLAPLPPLPRQQNSQNSQVSPQMNPRGTSPHDLYLATSRVRAPVLRTFVPCAALDEGAVEACEEQLASAGLWEHLSVGDVVCNFGYVPEEREGEREREKEKEKEGTQVWLLFDGTTLVPYVPPAPPPVEDPLSLPSPFYYAHILPPFSNPVFVLSLPALPVPYTHAARHPQPASAPSSIRAGSGSGALSDAAHLQLTLTHVPTRVRSPHSPSGWAVVRKFVWVARLPYVSAGIAAGLGRGWQGEWMLEGEGTREGRQSLLDAVSDGPDGSGLTRRGKWEVVRDKSGGGRLWMKLLVPNVDHVHDLKYACESIIDLPPSARTSIEQ